MVGVELNNPANQRSVEIYALLDTACDTTMLSDEVATELGLCGVRSRLAIAHRWRQYHTIGERTVRRRQHTRLTQVKFI